MLYVQIFVHVLRVLTCTKPIAKNALTMLINLSDDPEVLKTLATDDDFLESLLFRITVCQCFVVLI